VVIPEGDQHPVTLELYVEESDWLGTFDQVEIWRSRATSGGPYVELTNREWTTARLPVGADDAPTLPVSGRHVNIVGQQLDVLFRDQDQLSFIFTGTDPLTLGDIAAQITAGGRRLIGAYVTALGVLVLETYAWGTYASIRVTGGDAAVTLGFSTDPTTNQAFGRDPRLPLVHGQEKYQYVDGFGSDTYWYKIRFRNRLLGTTGEFTPPFQTGAGTSISATNIVVGYLNLTDLEGKPVANREVLVSRQSPPSIIEGALVVERDERQLTDKDGHASFSLVRGQPISLAIVGTNVVVSILPPTDLSINRFNLFDTVYIQQDDYFKSRVPNIPFAARRSL
jgi:hypothetical protein